MATQKLEPVSSAKLSSAARTLGRRYEWIVGSGKAHGVGFLGDLGGGVSRIGLGPWVGGVG